MSAEKKVSDNLVNPDTDCDSDKVVTAIADTSDDTGGNISPGSDAKIALALKISQRSPRRPALQVLEPNMSLTEAEMVSVLSERNAISQRFRRKCKQPSFAH